MKANEAPKKIYFSKTEDGRLYFTPFIPFEREFVEYIPADIFIEKALAYLNDKFYFNNVFYGIVSTDFNAMEEMYDDFRKYMKGE